MIAVVEAEGRAVRLEWIRFANFRGIPDFELEVRSDLVLVGPPDSGKSSLLLGLDLLLRATGQQLTTALSTADFTDPAKDLLIEARLVGFDDDERAAFPDEISLLDNREHLRVRLEATVDDADPDVVRTERFFPDAGVRRGASQSQREAIGWVLVPASRSLYRELGGARSGVVRSLLTRVDLGADASAVKEIFATLSTVLDASEALGQFRHVLAEALSTALPREIAKEAVRILLPGQLAENPLDEASLGIHESGVTRPLNEQSDGTRALAAVAAYSIAHLGANIVAIDEPEMHLHPSAQRLIAGLLRSGRSQVVMATHSSHVVANMEPKDIAALGWDRSPRQLPANASPGDYYFATRWWHDLFVLPVTANRVVAVEGPSDRIVVEAIARALELQLHRAGVHILDLGTANQFGNAYATFGPPGFGIAMMGLVDEDHRTRWASALGVEPGDLEALGYQVHDPDLEGEVVDSLGVERVVELLDASGLWTESQILGTLGASTPGDVSAPDLASFLRSDKARAAAGVARALTRTDASKFTKIKELLGLALR